MYLMSAYRKQVYTKLFSYNLKLSICLYRINMKYYIRIITLNNMSDFFNRLNCSYLVVRIHN